MFSRRDVAWELLRPAENADTENMLHYRKWNFFQANGGLICEKTRSNEKIIEGMKTEKLFKIYRS